ncbi:ABC transporter ATP-binding protein [Candidatus Parcubacteria bacterium]|nr:ABC transporter ATP-binding protein [Candidatus Parcubacteria bacterium]
MQEAIITANNLNFTYNKGKTNEYHALVDVSFKIYPNEYIIVFGPSGCGKSTLLNVIAGLEKPDTGDVFVHGRNMMKMKNKEFSIFHKKEVGMIFQQYNLISSLSVLDNVILPQIFINSSKRKRDKLGMELLDKFGIAEHAKKIPTELSGGEQQRIGIVRSIVNNPILVLADEPVGNLDSKSADNVLKILEKLNKEEKKTVIMVTHNIEYTQYGDRIIYMKDGIITKEVINEKDKHKSKNDYKKVKTRTPTAVMNEMMRNYRNLTAEQINILIMPYKAKVFAHNFITNRSMEEVSVFEDAIRRRMLGAISSKELYNILHTPSREGGVGFNKRAVEKVVEHFDKVVELAYFINQRYHQAKNNQNNHDIVSYEEKAQKTKEYLLDVCYHDYYENLNEIQMSRLHEAIKDRIKGEIQKSEFFNYLDMSYNDSGIGLNSKTAKAISEEIELVLVLGYGITSNKRSNFRVKQNENTKIKIRNDVQLMKSKISQNINNIDSPAGEKI